MFGRLKRLGLIVVGKWVERLFSSFYDFCFWVRVEMEVLFLKEEIMRSSCVVWNFRVLVYVGFVF